MKKYKYQIKCYTLFLSILFLSTINTINILKAENAPLIPIKLLLDWVPNTNHTGLVVAKSLGYYKQEGLSVNIIQPGKGSAEYLLAKGLTDFIVSSEVSLIEAHKNCLPVISIAAILAHNTSGFYSLKDKKITSPKDFEGKTYGSWGSEVELALIKSMMEKFGANFNKVKVVTIGSTDFFKAKNIDFVWGFEGWTGIQAKINKIPVNYIDIRKNLKLDSYTPIILTHQNTINNKPEIVQKFIKATRLGYLYAIKHPKEAAEILLKEYPELNKELTIESQKLLSTQYKDAKYSWGYQDPAIWENYVKWSVKYKIINNEINYTSLFTNKFITLADK